MDDPYDLQRFVTAQNPIYENACAELRRGDKEGHWMWFIFPQLKGLGHSAMASRFGIASREEAEAYLKHPILGFRIRECVRIVNAVDGRSAAALFGYPDDLKFRSSMTLFAQTAADNEVFVAALRKYFGGESDPLTVQRLA